MKRTTIIAILVVFALAATPLWTVNATADDVTEPINVDSMEPISVDAEPISVDGQGHAVARLVVVFLENGVPMSWNLFDCFPTQSPIGDVMAILVEAGDVELTFEKAWPCRYEFPIFASYGLEPISVNSMEPISVDAMEPISVDAAPDQNNEIHQNKPRVVVRGEMAEYVLLIIGEDGGIIIFDKGFHSIIRSDPLGDFHIESGANGHGILAQSNNEIHGGMAEYVLFIIGEDGGITILDESKGFSSLIRSEPLGDFHIDGIVIGGEWYQNADGSNPFDVAGGGGVSIGVSGGGDLSGFLSLLGVPIYTVTVE